MSYDDWRYSITYLFAYELGNFSLKDIDHYNENISDDMDKKIHKYLISNLVSNEKYFLRRYSWVIFKTSIIKTYIRCIARIIILYNRMVQKMYAPHNGNGYIECLERWNHKM